MYIYNIKLQCVIAALSEEVAKVKINSPQIIKGSGSPKFEHLAKSGSQPSCIFMNGHNNWRRIHQRIDKIVWRSNQRFGICQGRQCGRMLQLLTFPPIFGGPPKLILVISSLNGNATKKLKSAEELGSLRLEGCCFRRKLNACLLQAISINRFLTTAVSPQAFKDLASLQMYYFNQ